MNGIRKEYEMLFQLNAQVGGGYNAAFSKAQAQISAMQQKIVDLGKVQSDLAAYQKQQSAIEATRRKLETLQQQYDNIQKEISETEGFSSDLENKLLSKKQAIEKASAAMEQQTQKAQQMGAALREAGIDTNNLAGETDRLGARMAELKEEQQGVIEEAEKLGTSGAEAIQMFQESLIASAIQDTLKQVYEELKECTDASIEFESALTGVDKTTDLTDAELAALSAAVKDLATEIPVTTDEMLGIGEVAGQLGIAKENLLDFATVMSMLSTATTMAADEGATMLAQFANITQMDPSKYSNLASAIVALGNSSATTEQKITEMAQGIAASASLAGMSEADILGLSAAVSSLGIESQMGSTAVSKLISTLMIAVETGEGLEEFANIANMTAEEFTQAWGDNAVGALESFIVGLSDTNRLGQSAIVTLTDLGITETRMQRTIFNLSNSGDLLTRTIATANQAWTENTALTEEAEKRYATTASQQKIMQNAVNNLKVAIGDNFTPALRGLYSAGTDVTVAFTEFIEQNPALVRAVTAAVGVVGLATAGLAAYKAGALLAASATKLFASSMTGLSVIMGVTTGVAAFAAAAAALSAAEDTEAQQLRELTATSRENYEQLQAMKEEYEALCERHEETSVEAQYLARQIKELDSAFQDNKQTAAELAEETQSIVSAHNELMQSYTDAEIEINQEARSNENLIAKLQELMGVEGKSAETKQEILTIVEMLNEAMPQLGLAYDEYADSLNMSADAIETVVRAEVEREKHQANREQLKKLVAEENGLYETLQANITETGARQRELDEAMDAYRAKQKELGTPVGEAEGRAYASAMLSYQQAVDAAGSALENAKSSEESARAAYEGNQAAIEELKSAMAGYAEETGAADAMTAQLNSEISETFLEVNALAEAYTRAYNAALESVQGQYAIWDEAAEVVATSAGTINLALDSQVTYWQNYNTNLQSLSERSKDIEGLSDMIASFADGSTDSVNAVAGMANATNEELAAMVEDWQNLQAEQKKAADSIAELTKNLDEEMAALQQSLADDIAAMDLSEEAVASGKNTIQGFIDGANDMLPQVNAAYARIAQAASAALEANLIGNSISGNGTGLNGYAGGTHYAERGVAIVGEKGPELVFFNGGEQVMTAAETSTAIAEASSFNVMPAEAQAFTDTVNQSPNLPPIQVSVTVEGNASPDTVENLKDAAGDLIEAVLEAIDDRERDRLRRAY